jgi:ABC-2 type transport system permease protein
VVIRHIVAVTRKELQHIFRDRTTFILVMFSPLMLLILMAYALTVEIQHVPIAILDQDRSSVSRMFSHKVTAGDDLDLYAQVESLDEIENLLVRGKIKAAVVIHPSFARDLLSMKGISLQIIIDGTEPESGGFAVDHIGWRTEEFVDTVLARQMQAIYPGLDTLQPIDLRVRAWYNPSLKPRVDLIPGLISMVLGLPALSVALALAKEREHGTLEQLMATPIGRVELLLGKMIPYIIVGMFNVIVLPVFSMLWFDSPFNGNFFLYIFLSVFFLFAILSMGILLGGFIPTQAAAMALSFLVIFFPGFFLTGIFFPIASMPEIMRLEGLGLPGTHYAIICRGFFITGVGLDILWPYAVALIGIGSIFTVIAALFFRKKLG